MNMKSYGKRVGGWLLLLALCAALPVTAKVKLPTLLSDGMVLQRERPVRLWGSADAGERVEIRFVKADGRELPQQLNGKRLKEAFAATADAAGNWVITLPALKHGGPYRLTVNDVQVDDLLIGDVLLCSGQSNMELPVRRVTDKFAAEIAAYENPMIRHITVPKVTNFHAPQADMPAAAWRPVAQPYVMEFSALAYFTARALYERNGVPVGLVNSSWGGTPVEAWISEASLAPYPYYINLKRLYEDDGYCARIKRLEGENYARWNAALYLGDPGLHEATPWYAADYDDSAWPSADLFSRTVAGSDHRWGSNGLNPVGGSHWFRKQVDLPAEMAGKEATLRLGCIVDADSVYVNGTFVGTTGYQYPPRIYRVPAGLLRSGRNNITVRVISNGGYPQFVPEKPYKLIVGTEEISLEQGWKYRAGAPMPKAPSMMFFCYQPVCLYNAMIAPLANFTFKGAVWYQGESNVGRRNEYEALLTTMIADWRATFADPELPFYIVELADFLHESDRGGRQAWAEMRQIQAAAAEHNRRTVLIRNQDLGEWNDIHPLDKKTLGQRVAEAVEAMQ